MRMILKIETFDDHNEIRQHQKWRGPQKWRQPQNIDDLKNDGNSNLLSLPRPDSALSCCIVDNVNQICDTAYLRGGGGKYFLKKITWFINIPFR